MDLQKLNQISDCLSDLEKLLLDVQTEAINKGAQSLYDKIEEFFCADIEMFRRIRHFFVHGTDVDEYDCEEEEAE